MPSCETFPTPADASDDPVMWSNEIHVDFIRKFEMDELPVPEDVTRVEGISKAAKGYAVNCKNSKGELIQKAFSSSKFIDSSGVDKSAACAFQFRKRIEDLGLHAKKSSDIPTMRWDSEKRILKVDFLKIVIDNDRSTSEKRTSKPFGGFSTEEEAREKAKEYIRACLEKKNGKWTLIQNHEDFDICRQQKRRPKKHS
jgi:hypothetical protein